MKMQNQMFGIQNDGEYIKTFDQTKVIDQCQFKQSQLCEMWAAIDSVSGRIFGLLEIDKHICVNRPNDIQNDLMLKAKYLAENHSESKRITVMGLSVAYLCNFDFSKA